MDDMNNNQGFSGQSPSQNPNQLPGQQNTNQFQNPGQLQGQNTNQINQESGNTYWEAQSGVQNPNQAYTGQQAQQTPAQFYQNYQQQMGGNSYPAPQPQMQSQMQPPKKKSKKKLVASLVTIILVLAIAGTAYAFKDKIMDVLNIGPKDPAKYYASIEQDAINGAIDKVMESYNSFNLDEPMAYKVSMDLTYDKATLNSLLSGYASMTIEDLESLIGISLDSIGADMTIATDDSQIYDQMLLQLNNVDIITVELFMDTVKQELLMRLPDLSPAYIRQSIAGYNMEGYDLGDTPLYTGRSLTAQLSEQLMDLSPEETADFVKRYIKVITDNIKKVELTKGEEIKVGGTKQKCTLLTVTIDEETLMDIVEAVIDEAKNDKYILDLLPEFGISKDEYKDALESASKELKNAKTGSMDGELVMEVYVNDDDKVIGRTIEVISDGDTQGIFGYGIATKGKDSEYELYFEDAEENRLLEVTGSHVKEKDAYTGEAELVLNVEEAGMGTMSFTLEYEDLRTETKGDKVYSYGKLTLSSLLLMGMEFSVEYDVVDGVQHSKLSVGMGGTSIVGLEFATEYLKGYKIPEIGSSAEIFDSYDMEGYQATMNLDQFISNLSNRLGVDLQTIFESLFYSDFY